MAMLEPPQETLELLREAAGKDSLDSKDDGTEEVLAYCAYVAAALADAEEFNAEVWHEALSPHLETISTPNEVIDTFLDLVKKSLSGNDDDAESYGEDIDDGELICDVSFNLAYGGKILLHRTHLRLRRGHRYGLVGQNGAGKTTLMTAINNGKLDGWPTHLTSAYVDSGSNVDPVHEARKVLPYLQESTKKSKEECVEMLNSLKFTQSMMDGTIGELSGGWQMKLRLIRAVLLDADILLLDEPTNHLDFSTVEWLTDYLIGLKDTTVICVSHDTKFMENICSDVIHYEQRDVWGPHRKLVHYHGTMSEFVKLQPQAKHYFELATTENLKFVFPDPGRLEGIKSSTQKFLEMEHVDYRYPGNDKNTLTDVNLKMTLSSRVALLGANGAGKTTLVRMIVGETKPSNLGVCKFFCHHNLRVAYVAQHSVHHVEQHIEDSPVAYIQWRFKDGYDEEKIQSERYRISKEEQQALDEFGLEDIWSRRMRAGKLEYEVKKRHVPEKDNRYYTKDELLALGFAGLLKQADEKIAAREAGLDLRPVTTTEIQKHLDDFGLAQEFGTYGKIRGLSGGQKVKLVLAAAMWNCPHLLVMDEPTNYLDREALGALSAALNEWGGSVLMISHNKEFYSSVCKEEWKVADGAVTIEGISSERAMKAVAKKKKYTKELDTDQVLDKAGGNVNTDGDKYKNATTNFWGQTVSKKEARQYDKARKKGDVALMRKILQIPNGKVMPGYENLGDGTSK